MKTLSADVVVVGGGPAGSTAAAHLARAGLDVLVMDKAAFPRDKICGDALTPRAVRELGHLGLDLSTGEHPAQANRGLRLIGGGHRLELDWPEVTGMPSYGLTMPRMRLDKAMLDHAAACGARVHEQLFASEPTFGPDGWVDGITAVGTDQRGRKVGPEVHIRTPVVIAADGGSARMGIALGMEKRDDRPIGVAVRTYHSSPRHADPYIESWLELRARDAHGNPGEHLPGYGWLFPLGDGTVNVGLGMLNTSPQFGQVDYRAVLRDWVAAMGREWEIDESTRLAPVRSAALPMAFNRTPHFSRGVLLVGDAGGMVNPFNGEGIDYGMESARLAATQIAETAHWPTHLRKQELAAYPGLVRDTFGSYFTLGRVFAEIIGHPELMRLGVKYGMGADVLMRFVVKLLANIYQHRRVPGRDVHDLVITALTRMVPATGNE